MGKNRRPCCFLLQAPDHSLLPALYAAPHCQPGSSPLYRTDPQPLWNINTVFNCLKSLQPHPISQMRSNPTATGCHSFIVCRLCLRQAISAVAAGDAHADAVLRRWETDAAPGFLHTLLAIVDGGDAVAQVRNKKGRGAVDYQTCSPSAALWPG